MKITFLLAGTRGDIQPFVALAWELTRRGHQVSVAAPAGFARMIEPSGARHIPLSVNHEELLGSEQWRRILRTGSVFKLIQLLAETDRMVRPRLHREMLESCEGAQALVANLMLENSAASIAEKLKIPLILCYLIPLMPTGDFPSMLFPGLQLRSRSLNRLTHTMFEALYWQSQKGELNRWRKEIGLPATRVAPRHQLWRRGALTLHAYSSQLVPRPAEWGEANCVTGFLNMPPELAMHAAGPPMPELVSWLDKGPPPIYLGYWRLPLLEVTGLIKLATSVSESLGARVVIGANWTEQERAGNPVPQSVYISGSVAHDWLFPRCSAIVHHGGAGTTGAAVRSGRPMVVCPVFADQPFWARRVEELGVGRTLRLREFTAERLEQALRQIMDNGVRGRAERLGALLRQEDGLATAVRVIEERLCSASIRSS